jgi:Lrp/AsnC family transcriptional regulator
LRDFPHIVEAYRMRGKIDNLLRVAVPDNESYDRFYKQLISLIPLVDVSSSIAMDQNKLTNALQLTFN